MRPLLFFLFFPFILASENTLKLNSDSEPLLNVADCVNVASGDFFFHSDDIIVDGAEPLVMSRSYDSGRDGSSYMGKGMQETFPFGAVISEREEFGYFIEEEGGMFLPYRKAKNSSKGYGEIAREKVLKGGVTNTGKTHAHGRLFDREVYFEKDAFVIYLQDGTERVYEKNEKNTFCLKEERLPSGLYKVYSYKKLGKAIGNYPFAPKEIALKSPDKSLTFSTLNFSADNEGFKARGSNGQEIAVKKKLHTIYYHVPVEATSNWKGKETYDIGTYVKKKEKYKIRGWIFGNGIQGKVVYNDNGKVENISFGNYLKALSFKYAKGYTDVFNAKKNLTRYTFTDEKRLISKEHFLEDGSPYFANHYYWSTCHERDRLRGMALLDKDKYAISFKKLSYSSNGNLSEERLYGNLTGKSPSRFLINSESFGITPAVDCYYTQLEYSNGRFNTLAKESDNQGVRKEWQYMKGTNLPWGEYTYGSDGRIAERVFYEYDQYHLLTAKIIDDGSSKESHNFENVTYRLIERYQHHLHPGPYCGLLSSVTNLYLDFQTGREVQLSRKEFYYNSQGLMVEEKLFDANGAYYGSNRWTYSEKRECLSKEDALGRKTIFSYDSYGRNIREELIGTCFSKNYTYDSLGRVSEEKNTTFDGKVYATQYTYDFKGNKLSETNSFGHTTSYAYDSLGRLLSQTNPDGSIKTYAYDEAGNVISEIDEGGFKLEKKYTAYGKPYEISYPDGSCENIFYTLRGEAQEVIARDGSRIFYTYDYRGREIKADYYAFSGEFLFSTEKVYKGECLLYETDVMGRTTTYEYDGACRKIGECKGKQRIEYRYDPYGNQSEVWYGDAYGKVEVYDACQRVLESYVLSEGTISEKVETKYDLLDRPISIKKGEGEAFFAYDVLDRLIYEINTSGQKTTYCYIDGSSPEATTILPSGKVIRKIFDWRGNPVNTRILTPYGQQVAQGNIIYDPCGRELEVSESIIYKEECVGSSTYFYSYDLEGRLVHKHEHPNASRSREHYFSYDSLGRETESIKPDGVSICSSYDKYGFLEESISSENSIHFFYTNTPEGEPLKVKNLAQNREASYLYDEEGNLATETQETGLTLAYSYDALGRVVAITLPDQSQISYAYEGKYLKKVSRNGVDYTYSRDALGRAAEVCYPDFSNQFSYDTEGRLVEIKSPKYVQKLLAFDDEQNLIKQEINGSIENFSYDHLSHLASENDATYVWDSLDNRREVNGKEVAFNDVNQIDAYTYDAKGNRLTDERHAYSYNALDQLTQIISEKETLAFSYDHKGRRLFETRNGDAVFYFYLGEKELGRFSNHAIDQLKVMGSNFPLALELSGKTYYAIPNVRGDLAQILDEDLNLAEEITYSAFGVEKSSGLSPWSYSCNRSFENLIFFLYRIYDSKNGIWLTPDPIGTVDGPNLYAYVKGNPIQYIDPLGLFLRYSEYQNYEKDTNLMLKTELQKDGVEWNPIYSANYTLLGVGGPLVGFVNGISNRVEDFFSHCSYLSNLLGGIEVNGTHNVSFGSYLDLHESSLNVLCNTATTPAWLIAERFREGVQNKGYVLEICNSQGTAHVSYALSLLTHEERSKIHILAVAPSSYINPKLCGSVLHLVADWDFVPKIDQKGKGQSKDAIKYVGSAKKGEDKHGIQAPVYREHIVEWYEKIKGKLGL